MEVDPRQNEVKFVTVPGVLGILVFTLVLIVIAKPIGLYLYAVYDTRQSWLDPVMRPVERWVYRTAGVKDNHEMGPARSPDFAAFTERNATKSGEV